MSVPNGGGSGGKGRPKPKLSSITPYRPHAKRGAGGGGAKQRFIPLEEMANRKAQHIKEKAEVWQQLTALYGTDVDTEVLKHILTTCGPDLDLCMEKVNEIMNTGAPPAATATTANSKTADAKDAKDSKSSAATATGAATAAGAAAAAAASAKDSKSAPAAKRSTPPSAAEWDFTPQSDLTGRGEAAAAAISAQASSAASLFEPGNQFAFTFNGLDGADGADSKSTAAADADNSIGLNPTTSNQSKNPFAIAKSNATAAGTAASGSAAGSTTGVRQKSAADAAAEAIVNSILGPAPSAKRAALAGEREGTGPVRKHAGRAGTGRTPAAGGERTNAFAAALSAAAANPAGGGMTAGQALMGLLALTALAGSGGGMGGDTALLRAEIEALKLSRKTKQAESARLLAELKKIDDELKSKEELLAAVENVADDDKAGGAFDDSKHRKKRGDDKDADGGGGADGMAGFGMAKPTASTPAATPVASTATTSASNSGGSGSSGGGSTKSAPASAAAATTTAPAGTSTAAAAVDPHADAIAFVAGTFGVSPEIAKSALHTNGYDVPKATDALLAQILQSEQDEYADAYPDLSTDGLPAATATATATATVAPKPLLPQLSTGSGGGGGGGHHKKPSGGGSSAAHSNAGGRLSPTFAIDEFKRAFGESDDWAGLQKSIGNTKYSIREWKSVAAPSNSDYTAAQGGKLDLAQSLKFEQLQKTFPSVDDDIIRDVAELSNWQYDKTAARLTAMAGQKLGADTNAGTVADTTKDLIQFKQTAGAGSDEKSAAGGGGGGGADEDDESGTVSQENDARIDAILTQMLDHPNKVKSQEELYKSARERAETAAADRNKFFVLASQSYSPLTGASRQHAGAAAASHLAKARDAQRRMRAAHAAAAIEIFHARNAHLNSRQVIDLHGLHVTEALHIVKVLLKKLSERNSGASANTTLRIITGVNAGRKARLKPAVEVFLKSRRLKYTALSAGEFKVFLA